MVLFLCVHDRVVRGPTARRWTGGEHSPGVVMGPGILWVRILGKDDELPSIVGPVALAVEVEKAAPRRPPTGPRPTRARRRIARNTSLPCRPPPRAPHPRGRDRTPKWETESRKSKGRVDADTGRKHPHPSVGIPCWPSRGSTDSPGARGTRLRNKSGLHSRSKERQA